MRLIFFAAITICPESKCKQTVFNLTQAYHSLMKKTDNATSNEQVQVLEIYIIKLKNLPKIKSFLLLLLSFPSVFPILPLNSESMKYARAVSQICDSHLMTQFLTGQRYTNNSIYDHLRKVSDSKFNLTSSSY